MSVTADRDSSRTNQSNTLRRDVPKAEPPAGLFGTVLERIRRRRGLLVGLLVVCGGLMAIGMAASVGNLGGPDTVLIYHTVTRADLAITVTERGNLESQKNIEVFCEVDDINGDGIPGTAIVWIIPNGSSVEKGDLLVELDVAGHQEELDEQILDTDRARSDQIQAEAKYKNRIAQNETAKAEAELKVKLAKLELQMFEDEEKGTHRLEVEAIKREIEDVNNQILAAEADLELKKNDMLGIDQLFKLGYAGQSELDRAHLSYLQAQSAYAARMNSLKTNLATLEKKNYYERKMQELVLTGAVETAERNLEQVIEDNKALLAQAEAALEAENKALEKEEERLKRYSEQVEKCRITAPDEGMVAYAVKSRSSWMAEVREGAPMRPRQHILSLPNLKTMQVKTAVHESVLDQISPGLPATIRIDALHNTTYQGSVESVAVLPDQAGWMSSDTKVYQTIVTIDEPVENIKPGMTAVVEIHVERLRDVLSVPVQAIVQIEDDTWCYIESGGSVERCNLELGRTNDQFVEIREGLHEGDRVVLNPMALIEQTESSGEADAPENEPGDAAPLRDGHDH